MSRSLRVALLSAALLAPTLAAAAEGMPQLDFPNPLTKAQIVWGAIIFFALYLLLRGWALPQVEQVMAEREQRIAGDLEVARAAKERADMAVAELSAATAQARVEAQAAVNAAADRAKQTAAAQAAEANVRLEAQLAAAEGSINAARGAAMTALRQVARDTAETVVTRLTGAPADSAALDRAVTAALGTRASG